MGTEIVVTRRVEAIDPAELTVRLDGGDVLRTKSIVLAMGVEWRHLQVDSVDRFVGSGVYYGRTQRSAIPVGVRLQEPQGNWRSRLRCRRQLRGSRRPDNFRDRTMGFLVDPSLAKYHRCYVC
jgi:hypothetical protein